MIKIWVIRYSWWVDLQSLLQSNRSMAVHDHDSIYLQTNKYLSEGFVNDYAILVRDIYSYPLQTAKGQNMQSVRGADLV